MQVRLGAYSLWNILVSLNLTRKRPKRAFVILSDIIMTHTLVMELFISIVLNICEKRVNRVIHHLNFEDVSLVRRNSMDVTECYESCLPLKMDVRRVSIPNEKSRGKAINSVADPGCSITVGIFSDSNAAVEIGQQRRAYRVSYVLSLFWLVTASDSNPIIGNMNGFGDLVNLSL